MSKASNGNKEFLSRAEVASLFQVSPNTITRWAQAGKLPCCRTLGGHRRYERDAVEDLARTLMKEESHVESVIFFVPKLYGDHHVTAVRRLLAQTTGVEEVVASAAFQQVHITFDPDKTSAETLAARLEEAYYPVGVRLARQTPSKGGKDPAWHDLSLRVTQTQSTRA